MILRLFLREVAEAGGLAPITVWRFSVVVRSNHVYSQGIVQYQGIRKYTRQAQLDGSPKAGTFWG